MDSNYLKMIQETDTNTSYPVKDTRSTDNSDNSCYRLVDDNKVYSLTEWISIFFSLF